MITRESVKIDGMTSAVLLGLALVGPRITLDMPCSSVSTICAEMSRQTGTRYSPFQGIGDRKLTIVANGVSVADVQTQMADVLGAEWVETEKGQVLRLTQRTLADEQLQARAEYIAHRDALLDSLRFLAWCGRSSPQILQNARLTPAAYNGQPLRRLKFEQMKSLAKTTQLPLIATAMESGIDAKVAALLAGRSFAFSTDETENAIRISLAEANEWVGPSSYAHRFTLFYNQADGRLYAIGFHPNAGSSFVPLPDYAVLPLPELRDAPLSEQDRAWAKANVGEQDGRKAISDAAMPKSEYRNQAYGLADHARYISRRFGVPVIADAYRVAVTGPNFIPPKTLGQYVRELCQASQAPPLWPVLGGRMQGGWLRLRHAQRWRLQRSEVPEEALNPMETIATRGEPRLDDYATLAARLTPAQFPFFENRPGVLVRFPARPLLYHIPYLRLWNSLNTPQRAEAAKNGLNATRMSVPQRKLLYDALIRLLGVSIMSRETFEGIWTGNVDTNALVFLCQQRPDPVSGYDLEQLRSVPWDPTKGGQGAMVSSVLIQFRVGTNLPDSILTAFTIPKRP